MRSYYKWFSNVVVRCGAVAGALALFLSSCTTVKPYQRSLLNDEDMELVPHKIEIFETNFQTYREAASGGEGGKVGGGCGCN